MAHAKKAAPEKAPEAPSEGRYLSAHEIAEELGQRDYLVKRALARVASQIPWKEKEKQGTPGTGARIYHESVLGAVTEEIGRLRARRKKVERDPGAYWRALAALRLFKQDANALARLAGVIYDLLKKNPPSELLMVVHALPHPELALQAPTTLSLAPIRGRYWQAVLPELAIAGSGETQDSAVRVALKKLIAAYLSLEQEPSADPERWHLLQQLVRRLPLPVAEPTGPLSPVVVLEESCPTFGEWLEQNAPQSSRAIFRAWLEGASARLHGRSDCRFRGLEFVYAWREGYSVMGRYLEAGGEIACNTCWRPLPIGPPEREEDAR